MIAVKEHPIIFSTENVKAILNGRKTQTRRVIKPCSPATLHDGTRPEWVYTLAKCPYGQVGDRLWVREKHTFLVHPDLHNDRAVDYFIAYCDGTSKQIDKFPTIVEAHTLTSNPQTTWRWHPSIFMPRWASRITLEITEVRVERVQEITNKDAIAEGISLLNEIPSIAFGHYWDSLNAKRGYGWEVNPWVWVIGFKVG